MVAVLDQKDRLLLNRLQEGLPLVAAPFAAVGEELGLTEEEVLQRLLRLKNKGVIRRLGAVVESRRLGCHGTLAALKVPEEDIEKAVEIINSFPEVTHNYLRSHSWNIWFTITALSEERIEEILSEIKVRGKGWPLLNVPAQKVFKIRAVFKL